MKDREKQIEEMEMAREIHKALLDCMNNSRCRICEFKNDTPMSFCKAEYIAKAISKKYQPRLSENDIVLSKEEWLDLQGKAQASIFKEAQISQLKEELKQSNKETVEKIIKMIKQTAIPVAVGKYSNVKFIETSEEELNAIAKRCGVEIKE